MDKRNVISQIQNQEDLATYIERLRNDRVEHPEEWENGTLEMYLDAMAAFVRDIDGYYRNHNLPMPNIEVFRTIAEILTAAKVYE